MPLKEHFTQSSLSLSSEDWDRSEGEIDPRNIRKQTNSTPRNSVVFPGNGVEDTPGQSRCRAREGRSLSELMRLHAEKGTDVTFSAAEASRVADVLKQWINSGTSPYEGEDDFFSQARSQDDSLLRSKRCSRTPVETNCRPRGQSESVVLRRSPDPDSLCT